MKRSVRRSLSFATIVGVTASLFLPAMARADYFESRFHTIDSFRQLASNQPVTADVDGDGREDIIFGTNVTGSSVIFVAGRRADASIGFKQDILLPQGNQLKSLLGSPTPTGTLIVAVTGAGIVRTYRGWPLAEQFQFNVGTAVASAAIGDVDADGVVDLVVAVANELRVYSPETGQLLRALAVSATYTALAVAQVDADPALEIMAQGVPGLFIDGATLAIDWTQSSGFSGVVGEIEPNGKSLIVTRTNWSAFGKFNPIPWYPTVTATIPHGGIGALAIARLDNAAGQSILIGAGAEEGTYVYGAETLDLDATLTNATGSNSIGAVDVDGDGTRELAYFPYLGYAGSITVASSVDSSVKWQHLATADPLTRTAIGDVDGDGRLELVAAGSTVSYSNRRGSIVISDLVTGVEEWRVPASVLTQHPFVLATNRVFLEARAAGTGMNIFLAGTSNLGGSEEGGQVTIVDGVNKQVLFAMGPAQQYNPLRGRDVRDFSLFDYDGDGAKDFIVGTTALNGTALSPQLQIISGTTGSELLNSGSVGAVSQVINDVFVVGRGGSNPQLLVALPDRLRGYDTQTGQQSWEWMIANNGATLLRNPTFGDELAIYRTDGAVGIYSADTRQLRRSFTLPAPLGGLFALPGSTERFFAMHGEALALIDSSNGTVVAETEPLGPAAVPARPPAAYKVNDFTWQIAVGSQTQLHRKLLVLEDSIFVGSFDSSP